MKVFNKEFDTSRLEDLAALTRLVDQKRHSPQALIEICTAMILEAAALTARRDQQARELEKEL